MPGSTQHSTQYEYLSFHLFPCIYILPSHVDLIETLICIFLTMLSIFSGAFCYLSIFFVDVLFKHLAHVTFLNPFSFRVESLLTWSAYKARA